MVNSLFIGTVGAALVSCAVARPVAAATVIVTPGNFNAAFKAAKSGDTLRLIGTFGATRLSNANFSKVVTINAAQAVFTNTLQFNNVSNVKVSGGVFNLAGDVGYTKAALVYGGSNIWFDKQTVTGEADDYGVVFDGTTNAEVSSGKFSGLRAGVVFGSVTTGLATRNKVTDSSSDGIDISDSHFVTASYNNCSAGDPGPTAHADCIQLWSVTGNPIQSDIVVTHNAASGHTQGFTSFQSGGGGLRIQITDNVVYTSATQGIACLDCVDSIITGNVVSTMPGSAHSTNLNVSGTNNIVSANSVKPYRPAATAAFASLSSRTFVQPGDGVPDLRFAFAATVPEASTWAMLMIGFAAVGTAVRRRAAVRA